MRLIYYIFLIAASARSIYAQDDSCYGAGSIATSFIISSILTLFLTGILYMSWTKIRNKPNHLILETDPEKGKAEFSFDNPGFHDPGLIPVEKVLENTTPKLESNRKWNHWHSAFSGFTLKSEKKKTLDDSALEGKEIKVVALRSHDFTGLGFNICGNMKYGIFIKDILHRGPASESGKLNIGDRINSVTISFEHMVYEDALTILSYASPYEVMIEVKSGKYNCGSSPKSGHPTHPIYRSLSSTDLLQIEKTARRKLYDDNIDEINFTSLRKPLSQLSSLEKKIMSSPKLSEIAKSGQLKNQLDNKNINDYDSKSEKIELKTQKSENKYKKFGIKVLPLDQQKSVKSFEQNENNLQPEKTNGVDEVDKRIPPQAKKREKKSEDYQLIRNELNSSGIKRDTNGIPQEIPIHMLNAAEVAKRNRKSPTEETTSEDDIKTPKKSKGKAPAPPESMEEIENLNDLPTINDPSSKEETDNQSSINTIELNSSDITIHNGESEDNKEKRKTASTGDLSRFKKCEESNTGNLERAQSLDSTDTSISIIRRAEDFETKSDEDIFNRAVKEPRLSLILNGLNTFQRQRLKKSTEWGNLEDVILQSNQENWSEDTTENPTLNALFNKINEIRRESGEIEDKDQIIPKNKIWPTDEVNYIEIKPEVKRKPKHLPSPRCLPKANSANYFQNEIWPKELSEKEMSDTILSDFKDVSQHKSQQTSNQSEKLPTQSLEQEIFNHINQNNEITERTEVLLEDTPPPIELDFGSNPETGESCKAPYMDKQHSKYLSDTINFIFNERHACQDDIPYINQNISDDIKVSMHSLGNIQQSDDAKSVESQKHKNNVSNVTINNIQGENENFHSLEFSVNEPETNLSNTSELYTFAIRGNMKVEKDTAVTITTPDLIKNVTITEAINTLNNDMNDINKLVTEKSTSKVNNTILNSDVVLENSINKCEISSESTPKNHSSLTYITEIHVTPNNVSELEISNPKTRNKNLDNEFENYIKKFEDKNEENIELTTNITNPIGEKLNAQKEMHKIQEIVQEQLKKLPEMKFTTSSYESPSRISEKKNSQVELLKSNFEKSPPKPKLEVTPKSRIPVATTKTPPMSPERRDSKNMEVDNEKEILELMSSNVHATQISLLKYEKPTNKNVTITSIRNNSKIPSGLPVLAGSRPPVAPRKVDYENDSQNQVTQSHNLSNFKQWVFDPVESATNISVTSGKTEQK